jgi:hypothetical protein
VGFFNRWDQKETKETAVAEQMRDDRVFCEIAGDLFSRRMKSTDAVVQAGEAGGLALFWRR